MKKVLSLTLFVILNVAISVSAQSNLKFIPKLGLNLAGNHDVSAGNLKGDVDVNVGVDIGFDVLTEINPNVALGGGISYLIPRAQDVDGSGTFSFLPIYGVAKFYFLGDKKFDIGIGGQIGYNFFSGNDKYKGDMDLEGGFYFGIGAHSIINNKFIIEAYYKSSSGEAEDVIDVTYTNFTVSFGLQF